MRMNRLLIEQRRRPKWKRSSIGHRFVCLLLLVTFGLQPSLVNGQDDSVESSALSAAGVSSPSAAAQPTTFWSLVAQIPAACKACKAKCCASCCGQMINEMTKPLSLMTGGCIQCCPDGPAAQNPNTPGAVGAAAELAKCLEEAPQRIQAVRFMATADCGRFPEVQKALIQALRGDCSECVRYEAALAFNLGCCCSKPVMFALEQTVTGGTKDGFPREISPRVKQAAMVALQRCQANYVPDEPVRPEEPVPPETPATPGDAKPASPIPAVPPETPVPPTPSARGDVMIRPVAAASSTMNQRDSETTKIVGKLKQQPTDTPVKSVPVSEERSLFSVIKAAKATDAKPVVSSPAAPPRGLVARMWRSTR